MKGIDESKSGSPFTKRNTCINQSNGYGVTLATTHLGQQYDLVFVIVFKTGFHYVTLASLGLFLIEPNFHGMPLSKFLFCSKLLILIFFIVGASRISLSTNKTTTAATGCMLCNGCVICTVPVGNVTGFLRS